MNEVSAVQHAESGATVLTRLWHDLTHRPAEFEPEQVAARQEILQRGFDAQLGAVTAALHRLARLDIHTRDISAAAIRRGLVALLSHFPVYRSYDAGAKRSVIDQHAFARALAGAKAASPASAHAVLDHIDRWLGGEEPTPETLELRKLAGTRFQQLSAPVAAKAVEDTAFYRYGRLLSRNDVGFEAARLGCSIAEFHAAAARRLDSFPDSMLATATHDHKRGEGVRARLAVISEMPEAWEDFVRRCLDLGIDLPRPDPTDEIMLYQMIVGAWPLQLDINDDAARQEFVERLAGWQQKALREAKLRTDWTEPNEAYETTARDFLANLFEPQNEFLPLAQDFIAQIAAPGAVNGLVQTVLKMTVPGMPDFFQGTEFWDLSLVDPDNRRPVDYDALCAALAAGIEARHLLDSWRDGRIKLAVIRTVLALRRDLDALFARGQYRPLTVNGPQADRIIAFARINAGGALVVVVPRHVDALLQSRTHLNLDPAELHDSCIVLPPDLCGRPIESIFDANDIVVAQTEMRLDVLLSDFPLAILRAVDSA